MPLSRVILKNSMFEFENFVKFLKIKGVNPPSEDEFNDALNKLGMSPDDKKNVAPNSTGVQESKGDSSKPKKSVATKKKSSRKKSAAKKNEKSKS
tara:strand:+ start:41348 stop:41632 length:285 start_codon:yes stop_codon:yes gene_type:complete